MALDTSLLIDDIKVKTAPRENQLILKMVPPNTEVFLQRL